MTADMTNIEDQVEIPAEIADILSDYQRAFLNLASTTVRRSIVKVNDVLNSPQKETRLGDFYVEFAYLRQALAAEESPYISIDEIMSVIAKYGAEKDHTLFTRRGEPNFIEKVDASLQGETSLERRQGEKIPEEIMSYFSEIQKNFLDKFPDIRVIVARIYGILISPQAFIDRKYLIQLFGEIEEKITSLGDSCVLNSIIDIVSKQAMIKYRNTTHPK